MAERIMSTLNLALMNVSLARKELPQDHEPLLRNKKNLTDVRQVISGNPVVGESLQDAMQEVLCTLSGRFSSMEIKGEPVRVETAATERELSEFFELIYFIQPDLPSENLTKNTLMDNLQVYEFSLQLYCLSFSS